MTMEKHDAPVDRWTRHTHPSFGESYYTATHPSGLTLLVYPKERSTCYAALGVRYGSLHRRGTTSCPAGCPKDCAGECPGVAHFLEHKMFEMPDGGDADAYFASLGADVNAYTTYDRTTYQFTGDAHNFAKALEALLTLTSELHVTDVSVEREKSIITEEIYMDMDDPWDRCAAEMLRILYRSHPIREEICGTPGSIRRITADKLRQVFRRRYRLPEMVLSVSGPVRPEQVWDIVDATVRDAAETPSAWPGPEELPAEPEPTAAFLPRSTLEMAVAKPLFCIGIKDPAVPTDGRACFHRDVCMSLLASMLFSEAGEVYNSLYEAGLASQEMSYNVTCGRGYGFYGLMGESDRPEEAFDGFLSCMDRLRREGLSREEFDRCRRVRYADFVTGFDAAEDVAESLLSCALDGQELFECMDEAEGVTFEEVSRLFEDTFRPAQYAMAVIRSKGEHNV